MTEPTQGIVVDVMLVGARHRSERTAPGPCMIGSCVEQWLEIRED